MKNKRTIILLIMLMSVITCETDELVYYTAEEGHVIERTKYVPDNFDVQPLPIDKDGRPFVWRADKQDKKEQL